MAIEIINDCFRSGEEGPANPDVVRETDEVNQIVWLKSSPEKEAPKVEDKSI